MAENDSKMDAYLARIRKTIADSESLVSQAELRIAETDRMLERQGLSREQVMKFRFTEAQREAVNEELRRRGLEPIAEGEFGVGSWEVESPDDFTRSSFEHSASDAEFDERRRKFGMMMKPFQI